MNQVKNTNNYTYDPDNIAKSLQRAMSQNDDVSVIRYLNNARKEKIAAGGESTAQYKNDALTKAADEYEKRFEKPDMSKLYEARRANLTQGLKEAHSAAKKVYDASVAAADDDYSDARRLYIADEYKKSLDTEAGLARVGLGKGAANAATSGAGESARVKMLTDSAEGLRKLYKDEAKTKQELADKLTEKYGDAYEKYFDALDKTYADQAQDSIDLDKNYQANRIENLKINDERQKSDRDFEYSKQKDSEVFEYEKQKEYSDSEYEKAYKAFEATGVITNEEQADILGLPVGTESVDASNNKYKNDYEKAYNAFEATGVVENEEQAAILGLPVGTQMFEVSHAKDESEYEKAYNAFEATGVITSEEQAAILGLPVGTESFDVTKFKTEIATEERKIALDENKMLFENAFDVFAETGKVTSEEQARILGLNVGDTTLDAERLAFDRTYANQKLANEAAAMEFDHAYSLFEAVGSVTTQEQANILGIPVGTTYWKYVTETVKANATAQNANSNAIKANAAAQNANSNAIKANATAQNANTNAYKSETERLKLKQNAENDLRKSIQEKNKAKEG